MWSTVKRCFVIECWEPSSMLRKPLRFSRVRRGSRSYSSFWRSTKCCYHHRLWKMMLAISCASESSQCCSRCGCWHAWNAFHPLHFGRLSKNLAPVGVTASRWLSNGIEWIWRWQLVCSILLMDRHFRNWRFVSWYLIKIFWTILTNQLYFSWRR